MSKKLFVGGLSYNIDNAQLEEVFSKFGNIISCDVIMDRYSGRSKGFGFVELEDDAAEEAIKKLNDTELDGRKITVNIARPKEERPRSDNRRGGFGRDDRGPRGGGGYR